MCKLEQMGREDLRKEKTDLEQVERQRKRSLKSSEVWRMTLCYGEIVTHWRSTILVCII